MVKGLVFPKAEMKKYGMDELDLRKVPPAQLVDMLLRQVKGRYPNLYRVLVTERNEYMIKKLKKVVAEKPEARIVVVVGAGHRKEMEKGLFCQLLYTIPKNLLMLGDSQKTCHQNCLKEQNHIGI